MSNWTLFSNHGHVLFCLARDSGARLRDVAAEVGITERAVQKIVRDLQDGGMISIEKNGRRNSYRIHKKQTLRHNIEVGCKLRDLIKVVIQNPGPEVSAAVPVNESKQPLQNNPEPPDSVAEIGLGSGAKSQSSNPKKAKATVENTKSGEPKISDSVERLQGSLF